MRDISHRLELGFDTEEINDRINALKQDAATIFTSEEALSNIRQAFVTAMSPCGKTWKAPSLFTGRFRDPFSTTAAAVQGSYLDFQRALDRVPNQCSPEAVALLLYKMLRDCRDREDRVQSIAVMAHYWEGAAKDFPEVSGDWRYNENTEKWDGHPFRSAYMDWVLLHLAMWGSRLQSERWEFYRLCLMAKAFQ